MEEEVAAVEDDEVVHKGKGSLGREPQRVQVILFS